jgi:hypothetical protein
MSQDTSEGTPSEPDPEVTEAEIDAKVQELGYEKHTQKEEKEFLAEFAACLDWVTFISVADEGERQAFVAQNLERFKNLAAQFSEQGAIIDLWTFELRSKMQSDKIAGIMHKWKTPDPFVAVKAEAEEKEQTLNALITELPEESQKAVAILLLSWVEAVHDRMIERVTVQLLKRRPTAEEKAVLEKQIRDVAKVLVTQQKMADKLVEDLRRSLKRPPSDEPPSTEHKE